MKRVMETTEISVITDEIDPNKESDIAVHEENLINARAQRYMRSTRPYFFASQKFEDTMASNTERLKAMSIRAEVPFTLTPQAYTTFRIRVL